MKRFFLISTLCLLCLIAAEAQVSYNFSKSTASYANLTSPVVVSDTTVIWDEEVFQIPVPFAFKFMGYTCSNVFADGSGFINFNNDTPGLYLRAFGADLVSKGTTVSLSPVSYQVENTSLFRILKIEFKNAGFFNDAPSAFVNFQVWLYELDNAIEVHMGSSNIVNDSLAYDTKSGPIIGLFLPKTDLTGFTYSLELSGQSDNPNVSAADISSPKTLDDTPKDGSVYRFVPQFAAGTKQPAADNAMRLYPNPAHKMVTIILGNEVNNAECTLYDISGKKVFSATNANKQLAIDLSLLPRGVYYLNIQSNRVNETQRLVVR